MFAAQVIALIGTGMMTVALGLLAFKIAGDKAGAVLGTALAIKMIAYVGVAPVVGGFANFLPRRAFLVSMDITRASVALALPFGVWSRVVNLPEQLMRQARHDRSRAAAALLTVITFNWLFMGTVVGFFCSAALVLSVTIPQPQSSERKGGIYENTTRGIRIYLATPRLRGLLALNLSVAAAGAMVIVNTVVVVRGMLRGTDGDVAIALACFGGGSMVAALS